MKLIFFFSEPSSEVVLNLLCQTSSLWTYMYEFYCANMRHRFIWHTSRSSGWIVEHSNVRCRYIWLTTESSGRIIEHSD